MVMLASLVRQAAAALADYDIEIVEMHHNKKVDAPSGTALLLGEAAAAGRAVPLSTHSVRSRDGHTGARKPGTIGFAALRGGTVVGDHSVIFAGPSERIELTHRAEDRTIFANGAVRAALWARGPEAGLLLDGRRAGPLRMTARAYWIGVAARDHVEKGVAGGFCMFAHGNHSAVKRLSPAIWFAIMRR